MSASSLARRRRRRGNGRGGRAPRPRNRGLMIAGGALAVLAVAVVVAAGAGAIYGKSRYDDFVSGVVPPEQLIGELPRGGARIYARDGTLLYEFIDELSGLRRPVPFGDISRFLVDATVATEDQDYWTNNGLNIRGLARATYENFSPFSGSVFEGSGGSSLTQQLAKNVYIPREERSERSVDRKLKEAAIALELTDRYSKEQILEWYLNSISYGSIYVGVEAAAQGYLGKSVSDLTLAESALLAGIPQQPALYDPFLNLDGEGHLVGAAKARQRQVLNLMVGSGYITRQQADAAAAEEIEFKTGRFEIEAAHFVLGRVANEIRERFGPRALFDDGLEVVTSLDLTLQREAEKALEHWISEFEEQSDGHNGAVFALDPHTGQILVYVGSRDYFRDDIEGRNDNIISLNSPGSTLKPFTYMTAFMQGWSTGTGIIDAPFQIIDAATGKPFSPRNPIKDFQGVITAEKALGNSLNIPAFKTIIWAGVNNVVSVLKEVGFTSLDNPLGYGPALTLGGVDITLEDITFAYSVLANEGVMRGQQAVIPFDPGERTLEPVVLLKVTDAEGETLYEFTEPQERRVVASNFAWLVTSILSNGDNQCITFGVCNALALPGRQSAAKTGTSEPFEYEVGKEKREIGDTWALGYTPDLVAGVWAGNSDNSPMVNILSTSISWRTWRDFMILAHEHLALDPKPFTKPATGIVERELCWPSGRLPTDLCPSIHRYTGLFAVDVLPRDQESLAAFQDDWWQLVRIDTRTGLLAAPTTPAAFVTEEVRLVLPRDEIYVKDEQGEEIGVWDGLRDWAARYGIDGLLAPTEENVEGATLLRIVSPVATQTVQGNVAVIGRASSEDFLGYTVDWARAAAPDVWVRHWSSDREVPDGVLASWDTRTVPNGRYIVRVVLSDAKRGDLRFEVPLTIDNGADGAELDLAPWGQINSPLAGSTVAGLVRVRASAVSGLMAEAVLEFGPGIKPPQWTELARITTPTVDRALATWDTTELPDGTYTLRLTVFDRRLGSTEIRTIVTVKNEADDDTSD
ncbi:MAG: transglycosylase domain-containing protein [Dehalococcoidia bacterium]